MLFLPEFSRKAIEAGHTARHTAGWNSFNSPTDMSQTLRKSAVADREVTAEQLIAHLKTDGSYQYVNSLAFGAGERRFCVRIDPAIGGEFLSVTTAVTTVWSRGSYVERSSIKKLSENEDGD